MFKYRCVVGQNMSEEVITEARRTDTEYSWDMTWQGRGASCSTSPMLKMPLWICITDARDSIDYLMNEEDYDEDYSGTPEISINRYINGKYDDCLEIEDWEEAVIWADNNWCRDEWDAFIQRTKDYTAQLRAEAVITS